MNDKSVPQPGRHFGRIEVSQDVLDNFPLATAIFKALGFVPWDVSFRPDKDQFTMLGTSPLFRLIPPSDPAPYYTVIANEQPGFHPDGTPGMELIITVLEQPGVPEDITEPLTLVSPVVGGKQ